MIFWIWTRVQCNYDTPVYTSLLFYNQVYLQLLAVFEQISGNTRTCKNLIFALIPEASLANIRFIQVSLANIRFIQVFGIVSPDICSKKTANDLYHVPIFNDMIFAQKFKKYQYSNLIAIYISIC